MCVELSIGRTLLLTALFSTFAVPAARAANVVLETQGFVLDSTEQPLVSPSASVSFAIFGSQAPSSGETSLWQETYALAVRGGYYTARLGDTTGGKAALDDTLLASGPTWLQVSLGSTALLPRLRMLAPPTAASAARLDCTGCVTGQQLANASIPASKLVSTFVTDLGLARTADLATVATSGAYADLSGRPTLAAVATSGAYADLSGRPTLAAVASSGAWADLSGRPDLSTYTRTDTANTFTQKQTFNGGVSLGGAEAQGLRFQNAASAPATCTAANQGLTYWDTAAQALTVCTGTSGWVAVGTAFTPKSVPNLQGWWRADQGVVETSGRVSQWSDLSPAGNHMTQAVATSRPVLQSGGAALNNQLVLHFTFASTDGIASTLNLPTTYTILYVARMTGTNSNRVLTAANNNWLLGFWGGREDQLFAMGWVSNPVTPAPTVARLFTGVGTGTATSLYRNGTLVVTNAGGVTGPNGLGIGVRIDEPSDCDVAEVIAYDRVLSTTERQAVETYLNERYAIY